MTQMYRSTRTLDEPMDTKHQEFLKTPRGQAWQRLELEQEQLKFEAETERVIKQVIPELEPKVSRLENELQSKLRELEYRFSGLENRTCNLEKENAELKHKLKTPQ